MSSARWAATGARSWTSTAGDAEGTTRTPSVPAPAAASTAGYRPSKAGSALVARTLDVFAELDSMVATGRAGSGSQKDKLGLPGDESSNDESEESRIRVISAPPAQPLKSILKLKRPPGSSSSSRKSRARFAEHTVDHRQGSKQGTGGGGSNTMGSSSSSSAACFNFSQSGKCRFGDRCKYSHAVAGFQATPSKYTRYELKDTDGDDEAQQKSALIDCLRMAKAAADAKEAASGGGAGGEELDARPPPVDSNGRLMFNAPKLKKDGSNAGKGSRKAGAGAVGGEEGTGRGGRKSKGKVAAAAAVFTLSLMDDDVEGEGMQDHAYDLENGTLDTSVGAQTPTGAVAAAAAAAAGAAGAGAGAEAEAASASTLTSTPTSASASASVVFKKKKKRPVGAKGNARQRSSF
eukprot:gene1118-19291_t